MAPSDWRPATPVGIVIDDLDPGFSVEEDGEPDSQGGPMGRFRPSIPLDRGLPQYSWMIGSRPGGMWLRQEVPSGWGKYRHTIVRATPGAGFRRVLFATELPAGRWQLDFHVPHDPLPQLPGEAYVEPSFIGQLGRYEMWVRSAEDDLTVEFDGSAAAPGWNKLGTYDLEGGPRRPRRLQPHHGRHRRCRCRSLAAGLVGRRPLTFMIVNPSRLAQGQTLSPRSSSRFPVAPPSGSFLMRLAYSNAFAG